MGVYAQRATCQNLVLDNYCTNFLLEKYKLFLLCGGNEMVAFYQFTFK